MYQGYEGIKSSTIPIFPLNATVLDVRAKILPFKRIEEFDPFYGFTKKHWEIDAK